MIRIDDIELSVIESISVSGGTPRFQFLQTVEGLPKPYYLGREPYRWSFSFRLKGDERETLNGLLRKYEDGDRVTLIIDDDSFSAVILSMSYRDFAERIEVDIELQEVDADTKKVSG